MKVYGVGGSWSDFHSTSFYSSKELALKWIKQMAIGKIKKVQSGNDEVWEDSEGKHYSLRKLKIITE